MSNSEEKVSVYVKTENLSIVTVLKAIFEVFLYCLRCCINILVFDILLCDSVQNGWLGWIGIHQKVISCSEFWRLYLYSFMIYMPVCVVYNVFFQHFSFTRITYILKTNVKPLETALKKTKQL